MIRLQGKEFANMKSKLEMIGYTKSSNGNYCAIMKLKDSADYNTKYTHWLNPEEIKRFESSYFFKTHSPLSQAQVSNLRSHRTVRNEIYQILKALNEYADDLQHYKPKFDNLRKKLYTNYTNEDIQEILKSNETNFINLKDMRSID